MRVEKNGWHIVYKKAINPDGSLFFPERLTTEYLEQQKRTMGSYFYANQYMNEVFPADEQVFKPHWFRYYKQVPEHAFTFGFIDPALSTEDGADYTALVVVQVDHTGQRYLVQAKRERLTPTQIVEFIFSACREYDFQCLGVEDVAYQKALLYMLDSEMRKRSMVLPVKGINPGTQKTKETRILGLVPYFEWGRILLNQGLHDFEAELMQFPRGSHDDMIDALAQIDSILYLPSTPKEETHGHNPNHPDYEREYIRKLTQRQKEEGSEY